MTVLALLLLAQVPLPGTSSVTVGLSPPIACARCHSTFEGSAHDTWTGSVMGHAARDPAFLASLSIAEGDHPGVGDFCLRCHAPEAWLQGRCLPPDGSALEENDSGVTCSFCHRNEPNPYRRNGQYIVADDSVVRGPYADAQAPHSNRQSPWISNPALCGTCHDLYNPLVQRKNLDGTPTRYGFPEQTTYTEWLTSAFADANDPQAKDCKGCHLPEDGVSAIVALNGPERPDRSAHSLAGSNVWLLDAIETLFVDLGISDRLGNGRAAIREMLRRAATLELVAPPAEVRRGQRLTLTVRITNQTGHKLPTGYPEGRKMFLTARSSTLGIDRGAIDRATGQPVDALAVYEARHGQAALGPGGPGHHIAINDTVYFDNRIPPRGFVVSATTAPVGKTYAEVSPGVLQHWDDVTLTATVPCALAVQRVVGEIGLWHLVQDARTIETLIAESATVAPERSQRLRAAWDAVPARPEPMATLRFELPVVAASTCDPPDSGVVDAGVVDTGVADAAPRPDASSPSDAGIVDGGESDDDGEGCGCRTTHRPTTYVLELLIVVASLAWFRRTRQRIDEIPRSAGGK